MTARPNTTPEMSESVEAMFTSFVFKAPLII